MNHSKISPELITQAANLAQELYRAIQSGDRERILAAQIALTQEAHNSWSMLEHSSALAPNDKALARLLADMTINELPELIQDPANYPKILSQLRLLKNSMTLL